MKKRSERRKHRPPVRPSHTHRQDRLQYTVLQLASAQRNYPTTADGNVNLLGGGKHISLTTTTML